MASGGAPTLAGVRLHGHVVCDVPGCGATVPDDSPKLAAWEFIAGHDAPDADLCPSCSAKKEAGTLADPTWLECVRCGRTHRDGVTHWIGVRADAGNIVNVCRDCQRDDDYSDVI